MPKPWETYQTEQPAAKPWEQFSEAEPAARTVVDDRAPDEEPGIFDQFIANEIGALEGMASLGSAILAEPISGLIGGVETVARMPFQGRDVAVAEGAKTVEGIQEAMTFQPRGETGQAAMAGVGSAMEPIGEAIGTTEEFLGEGVLELTGSPGLATLAHMLPTAAMEALGLGALKKSSKAAEASLRAKKRARIEPDMSDEQLAKEVARDMEPEVEDKTYLEITADLKAGRAKKIAAEVRPDEQILRDAEEIGGLSLNPGDYSTNESFRRVEGALTQRPDSDLAANALKNFETLAQRADEMIVQFGGDLDKSLLSDALRDKYRRIITDLGDRSDQGYKLVAGKVPEIAKSKMLNSRAYMAARLKELGGDATGLTKPDKILNKLLSGKGLPNYGRLDALRKEISKGYKGKGIFKDADAGDLKQVYKVLIRDQQKMADVYEVGDVFKIARKEVKMRKDFEDRATAILGNELQKSIVPQLKSAAGNLTKGDLTKFRQIMEALPSSADRARVSATILGDIFASGARSKSFGQGFVTAYDQLMRNPTAKAELFKHMRRVSDDGTLVPAGAAAERRFDAIANVSRGMFRMQALSGGSPTARFIMAALGDVSLAGKIIGKTVRGVANYATGGVAGMVGDVAGAGAEQAAKQAKRGETLLLSPQFNNAIEMAAQGRVKQAEIMLKRSKVWQAWRNTLGEGTKSQLVAVGPIAWLTQQEGQPVGQ